MTRPVRKTDAAVGHPPQSWALRVTAWEMPVRGYRSVSANLSHVSEPFAARGPDTGAQSGSPAESEHADGCSFAAFYATFV